MTQAHTNICAERGHATHKVDGVPQPRCPRCGELRDRSFNEEFADKVAAFNATAQPHPGLTPAVQQIANDLMVQFMTIIDDSRSVKFLNEDEYAALMLLLADGFNDTTKD